MRIKPFISIICPTLNEEHYISSCIKSILLQDYSINDMEVLFIDGLSTDNTCSIINSFSKLHPFIKLLTNPFKFVPNGLNIGILSSRGDVIIRIDAHSTYPSNYISTLVYHLFTLKADNVGGIWNTLPANESLLCKAIAIGVCHPFGIGNSLHKVGVKKIIETDTVPFGCFHKNIFQRIGYFDEELIRNQDDEFNGRIIKNGGKIYLIPNLVIDYYTRNSISKMSKMFYQYGFYKPLVNKKLGSIATLRQIFPFLFVLGLIFGFTLSIINEFFLIIYISVLFFYFFLSFYFSFIEAFKQKKIRLLIFLPYIFFVIHLSYGWGYIVGIIRFLMFPKIKLM